MAAAKASALLTRYREEAAERRKAGQEKGGEVAGRGRPIAYAPRGAEPIKPKPKNARATDAIGKRFDVSGRSVDRAVNVVANAAPEVIEAVERGEVTELSGQAKFPASIQNEFARL